MLMQAPSPVTRRRGAGAIARYRMLMQAQPRPTTTTRMFVSSKCSPRARLKSPSFVPIAQLSRTCSPCPWVPELTAIRFALAAARLDLTLEWKAQEKDRIQAACNVIREDYPEVQHFIGDWGFNRLVQESFSGSKLYRKCTRHRHSTEPTSVNGGAFLWNDMSDDYVPDSDDSGDGGSDGSEYVLDSDEDNGSEASDLDAASCITVSEDGGDLEDEFYMQEDWEVGCDEVLAIFDRTRNN
ncbi:hypothetical protein B0H14DRAFT_2621995 [Mycena olivaceomarginata]|nr:hypothetical protein B0H14DRAFT_2621995 [Mycena olivaceomarginata]